MLRKLLTTIGLITLGVFLFVGLNTYSWERKVNREVKEIINYAQKESTGMEVSIDVQALPEPVQRYMNYVFQGEMKPVSLVRLKQEGVFRTTPEQEFLPLKAEEYFLGNECSFLWKAKIKKSSWFWLSAREKYYKGKGKMTIKMLSSLNIAQSLGDEVNASSLMRYGSETPWFPSSFLYNNKLKWESIDASSARLYVKDGENEGTIVYYFNDKGEIIRAVAQDRQRDVDGEFIKTKWTGNYGEYKEVNGVKIPTYVEFVWNLPQGEFQWAKLNITDIEYDSLED